MRALLTVLRHPIAVWRMARTMRAASTAVLRAEQARYAQDVAEFEATSRRLHQARTDLEYDVTTLRHHVTLTREHLAMLSADADA